MKKLIPAAVAALSLFSVSAFAHTGHLMDHGDGHEHVTGLIALGIVVGGLAAWGGIALFRRMSNARKA